MVDSKKLFRLFILFSILTVHIFLINYIVSNKQSSAVGDKGDLVLTLLSNEDNKGIAEATFDLKNSSNKVLNQLVTDSNGRATIIGLSVGNYKLVQKTTGIGHMLPKTIEYDISIQDGVTTYIKITNNKRVASDPIPIDSELRDSTTLRLKVVDGENRSKGISGSKFILKGDTILEEITTGDDGTVNVKGLTYGTYSLTQIFATDGYLPIDKETTFEIPKPILTAVGVKYAEFKDIQIDNLPYDKTSYGVLNINVFDGGDKITKIPNVTLKLVDTLNDKVYIGTTNSDGNVSFKGISLGPQRKFSLEIVRAPYDYESSGFKFEETFEVPFIGGREQNIYLPKKTLRSLIINNYEKGDLSIKIGGGTFRLYHEDGTSEVISIDSNGSFNKELPHGNYILEQLTSDSEHIVNSSRIPFRIARDVELNIENELVNPESKKVSITFNKVWIDKPTKKINSRVYLYANGEKMSEFVEISSSDETEKTFSNLPKFDAYHNKIIYSLKEDAIEGYYPVYEQKSDGKWTIKNYRGTMDGVCTPPLVWMSTANNAYSFILKNGVFANQEISFPNDAQYGQSLAYQKEGTLLFAAGMEGGDDSDSTNAKLVVYDVSKGVNGKKLKTVSLGDLGLNARGFHFNNVINGSSARFKTRHNKVNTMGISSDQKYILVKHNVVPEVQLFKISDILNATEGETIKPVKKIDVSYNVSNSNDRQLSDGDIVQYPNGDILFTGHEFSQLGDWSQRRAYKFYLVKYNGDINDVGTGSYGNARNVGTIVNPTETTVVYKAGAAIQETHRNLEGLAIVSPSPGDYRLYVATNKGEVRLDLSGGSWSGNIKRGWAEVVRNDNSSPAMPGWKGIGGENFAFKLKPVSLSNDIDKKFNPPNSNNAALIADMTAAEGDSCYATTSVRGVKIWQGDDESTRPDSITIRLFSDGVDTGKTKVVTKENNWKYEFDSLPKYKLDSSNNETGTAIEYTIKEDSIPKGYSYRQEEGTYNIINTYGNSSFQFRKTNKDKNISLSGASFTLYNEDKSKIIAKSTSDVNGIVKFDNLTEGIYKLEETVAPNGYELSRQEYTVKGVINKSSNKLEFKLFNNGVPIDTDGKNYIITNDNENSTKLIIRKSDDLGLPLSGVEFRMTNLTDHKSVTKATGENGELIFDNLKIGKYKLEETRVPNGFKNPTSDYEVTVTSDLRVLVSTIEKARTTRFRFGAYGENLFIANSVFSTTESFFFRSSTNNISTPTIPEPYYRNNNPETISSNNIITKQNISATSTKGKYKVDVEVSGNGMINEGSVYVFAIEKSKWMDININFRDILSDAFSKIKQKDPNAKVGVITSTNNISEQVIYMKDVDSAINEIANVRTSYYDRNLNARNFGNVLLKAEEFFKLGNNATAKNKILVQFMSTGIGGGEATYIENEIKGPLSKLADLGVSHKIIYQGSYSDPKPYYKVPIETFSGDKQTFAKNKISEMINHTNIGPGTVGITLNNNVIFDGFVNPNNDLSIEDKKITVKNISRRKTNHVEPYSFSYYVRSNTDITTLNEFIDINSSANFKPYNNDSVISNIPIPKVGVPGIKFKVNKTYTDDVTSDMMEETTINLLKNGIISESIKLNSGYGIFNNAQPIFDNNGDIIKYSINEEGLSNNLDSTITPEFISGNSGTFSVATDLASLNLKVTKEWVTDNTKGVRVRLVAKVGNKEIDIKALGYIGDIEKNINALTVVDGEVWSTVFKNIPRKTKNGEYITYEVREISVGDSENSDDDYKVEYFINEKSIKIVNREYTKLFVTNFRNPIYKFKIVKVDQNGHKITSDSRFSIDTSETGENVYNGQIATLNNGEFEFNNGNRGFAPGIYYLREVVAPTNYLGLGKKIKIQITEHGEIKIKDTVIRGNTTIGPLIIEKGDENLITIKVKNEILRSKFAISKRIKGIERTGRHITSPVTFQLTKDEDNSFNNITLTKPSDENFVFENLPVGTYTLKEIQAPLGYVKTGEYYKVVVENNGDLLFKTYTVPNNGESTEIVRYDGRDLELHKQSEQRITKSEQSDINDSLRDDNKLILIGNIQNPKLKIRKVNSDNNLIKNNRALFKLYKIDNNSNNNIESNNISGNPELILEVGANGESNEINPLTLTELGKYALVEEIGPSGYERIQKPIVLELYEKEQEHSHGINKKVTSFRVLTDEFRNVINISSANNDPNLILLSVKNTKIVDFSIRKLDDNTNNLLNGVRFKLAPKDRNSSDPSFDDLNWHINNMEGSESNELIDGKNRKVIRWTYKNGNVPGIRVKEGTYVLTEEYTPNTHEPIPSLEILVDSTGIKPNPTSNLEIKPNTVIWPTSNVSSRPEIRIRNFKRPQITIVKVGEDGVTKLSGVRLKIKSKDVNTPKPLFDDLSWHVKNMFARVPESVNENWISWQTNSTEIPGLVLREGSYIIEEESVPIGYKKFEPFEIRVDKSGGMTIQNNHNKQGIVSDITNDNGKQRLRLVIKNERSAKLKIKKISTLGNTPLDGVKFQLFEENGTTTIGTEKTTSSEGIVEFDNLSINKNYVIKEIQTVSNHILNDKKYKFKINNNGDLEVENKDDKFIIEAKESNTNVVTIKNEPKKSEYPETGGFGIIVTSTVGIFIASISYIMMCKRRSVN